MTFAFQRKTTDSPRLNNLSWTEVLHGRLRRISFFSNIRRLFFCVLYPNIQHIITNIIKRFAFFCASCHWFYASRVIFPGLLQKDTRIISRSHKLLSFCSSLSKHLFVQFIKSEYIKDCQKPCTRIPIDSSSPIHEHPTTSLSFKHLQKRTRANKCSTIP